MKFTILLTCFICSAYSQKLTKFEVEPLVAILRNFSIFFATLASESPTTESTVRIFSDNKIAINIQKPEYVAKMVKETTPINYPTVIILRSRNFEKIFKVKMQSRNVRRINRAAMPETEIRLRRDKWIWAVILQPGDDFPDDNIEIPFDVQLIVFEPFNDGFNVWEQYHIFSPSYEIKFERVRSLLAFWSPKSKIESKEKSLELAPRNMFLRRDLKNSTIIGFTCKRLFGSPFRILTISPQVMTALQTMFGFNYVTVTRGLNYDVETCEVTLINYKSPPVDRIKWTIGPLMKLQIALYYQQPPVRPLENYALEPFGPDVWGTMALWIIIAAICIKMINLREKFTIIDGLFQVFHAFCCQGDGAEGKSISMRLVNLAIWLTVVAVTASYSAIIFTFIVIRQPHVPFNNMDEFVKDGTYNYSGMMLSLAADAHTLVPNDSAVAIAHRKYRMPDKYWVIPREGINLMCKYPKIAYAVFINQIEEEYWPCPLKRMRDMYFEAFMAVPSRPFTPYIRAFNEKLPLMRSSGVLSFIRGNFERDGLKRDIPVSPPPDIDLLKHVLLIVPVASVLSVMIAVFESFKKRRENLYKK